MGIGRCLRIAAAGDEHLLNVRMDDIALPLAPPGGLAQLSANHPTQLPAGLSGNKVPWTREVPLPSGSVQRVHHARNGAGVATVHDNGEVYPRPKFSQGLPQPVVAEGIFPIQIGRTQDLVALIRFISIVVRHVGSMPRIMEEQDISLPPFRDQILNGSLHRFFRRLGIRKGRDVFFGEAVIRCQRSAQILHIVDASLEVRAGDLIFVDPDEHRSLGHTSPFRV